MKFKISILFIFITTLGYSQQDVDASANLINYYQRKLNFGFLIGYNQADFNIDPVVDVTKFDSLKYITATRHPGFNLGIISDYAFHKYLTLRFTPNIAFCERTVNFDMQGTVPVLYKKSIESTFLNFPLNIKLRSKRVKNFGAYLLTGGAYSLDLASKKNLNADISPVLSQQLVKLKRDDFSYEVGAGTEFYLMYFKFAIEAKLSIGTQNLLIKENTIFANAINKLNSKVFLISFTFEG